jgi:TRAP-type mannitol/chloroaromatic compound transport system permease small subunit
MDRLLTAIDGLNEILGRAIAWLTLGMVLVTFLVVVARYAFGAGSIALQESVTWMHAAVFMLGAAYTLKHDEHVRVDLFHRGWSARTKAGVEVIGVLVLLVPTSALLLWLGWDHAAAAWRIGEGSREAGGLPGVYLLKSLVPLGAALLLMQGFGQAARAWRVWRA